MENKKEFRYFLKELADWVLAIVAVYIAWKIIDKMEKKFDTKDKALEYLTSRFEGKE